jgi:glycosyltransferase involved in cell wall biosynthesis
MTPKVSIIVTVYNTEKYLNTCIDSILNQTFKDFECIIVDNCSPDNSPQICDEYKENDNRIKVIHKKQNGGLPQARKTGFEISAGGFILFVDSDDWIEPDMVEKMYNKALEGNYDIIKSNCFINTDNYQIKDITPQPYDKILIYKNIIMYWQFSTSVWDKMVKRDVYEKVLFPIQNYIEDRVITIQSIYYAKKIGYIPDYLYHYRQHPESICSSQKQADKTIDEYHNFIMILDFLKDKKLIHVLEHELCYRINSIKLSFLKERRIRKMSKNVLDNLYPESTKNLFSEKYYINIFNKVILFLAIKKNPLTFIIIDIFIFFELILKKIYRAIIPANIRSTIKIGK